jgi:hypothetical protein
MWPDSPARGKKWMLNHSNSEELSKDAKEKIVIEFDNSIASVLYIKL